MLDQLTAARLSVDAREHAGVGRGIDDPIHGRKGFKIRRHARIAMKDFDACRAQIAAVCFGARARRLSMPKMRAPSMQLWNERASDAPAKPQIPAMKYAHLTTITA